MGSEGRKERGMHMARGKEWVMKGERKGEAGGKEWVVEVWEEHVGGWIGVWRYRWEAGCGSGGTGGVEEEEGRGGEAIRNRWEARRG